MRRPRIKTLAAAAGAVAAVAGGVAGAHFGFAALTAPAETAPAAPPARICGSPVLDSPWSYNGTPGTYSTSGTPAGLPTFGAAGTNFPNATKVIVVAAGDNTAVAHAGTWNLNNVIVYFEPGEHDIQTLLYAGDNSAYVGGYDPVDGKAVINGVDGATDGTGLGGSVFEASELTTNNNVNDTWEYLTVENYTSGRGNSVMGNIDGGTVDNGDTYKYDTIGPNNYGYVSNTSPPAQGQSNAGGYAINGSSYTTVEYSCLEHDSEGGVNITGGIDTVVADNEFAWNGIGEYPDFGGPGASPYSCGCSATLGKFFYTVNADVVNNYIHDGYSAGVWFDTNNTGALISHNWISSNWASGILYESNYNANISDNTLQGNQWASDGAFPAGTGGLDCFASTPCQDGEGLTTAGSAGLYAAAISTNNSGGDPALSVISIPSTITVRGCASSCTVTSRYSGHLYIEGNQLTDNFGGISTYSDTSRFPLGTNQNQACDDPLGSLYQNNNATYYHQGAQLVTASDTSISGTTVTSTAGTVTECADYSAPFNNSNYGQYQATPETAPAGMKVFDQATGLQIGTVASGTSSTSFALTAPPPGGSYTTGDALVLSATGGCGIADYYGASQGVTSGSPAADYWDHCAWISHNVTVSGNSFTMNAATVANCTGANGCGWMQITGFNAGIPPIDDTWNSLTTLMGTSPTGAIAITWSGNTYTWTGTGAWGFHAGNQNGTFDITRSAWLALGEDAGSVFS